MNKCSVFFILLLAVLFAAGPVAATEQEGQEGDCSGRLTVGYRNIETDGDPARAAEYRLLEDGPVFGAQVSNNSNSAFTLLLDAEVQDERDYQANFDLRYRNLWRLDLQAEGLVHNLEHIPYQPGAPEARPPATYGPNVVRAIYSDDDPGRRYDLEVDIYQAHLRGKLPSWPAHVNLTYWRFEREGKQQLRFADENCAGACHMQSTTRDVDRVTEEVRGGVDAHLGFFDIAFEQLFRQFRDKGDAPVDDFLNHTLRPAGTYAHDTIPDSRLVESSVKANTSPAGGFVLAGGFALGERENRSDDLGSTRIEAETDYYKANGDVTYTPSEHWTLNFRYRLLDMDASNNDTIRSDSLQPDRQPVDVRDALDLRRAFYAGTVSYRPNHSFTIKADYRREDIHRGNTGEPIYFHSNTEGDTDPVWELPEEEIIDRFRLGFNARFLPRSALRVNGWGEYRTSDDPAYGTSFEDGREAFFGVNWTSAANWGTNISLRALDERNNKHEEVQFDASPAPARPVTFDLDRRREQQDLSGGIWVSPVKGVTLTTNYAYMRTKIVQDLLFGGEPNLDDLGGQTDYTIRTDDTEYSQRVHTLSAGIAWQIAERLGLAIEGYRIRSEADYSPEFFRAPILYNPTAPVFDVASSADLREISRIDIRQNGLNARLDWQVTDQWGAVLAYTFDDYDDKNGDVFDGTVQTCLASISRTW